MGGQHGRHSSVWESTRTPGSKSKCCRFLGLRFSEHQFLHMSNRDIIEPAPGGFLWSPKEITQKALGTYIWHIVSNLWPRGRLPSLLRASGKINQAASTMEKTWTPAPLLSLNLLCDLGESPPLSESVSPAIQYGPLDKTTQISSCSNLSILFSEPTQIFSHRRSRKKSRRLASTLLQTPLWASSKWR